MKKTVYIAGKVSGLPEKEVADKFNSYQQELENLGYKVVNPVQVVNNPNADWKEAMKLCITALVQCDVALFLEDYPQSKGALLEFDICRKLEIKRYFSIDVLSQKEKPNTDEN